MKRKRPEYYTVSELHLVEFKIKRVSARQLAVLRMAAANGCKQKLFRLCVKELCLQGVSKNAAIKILCGLEMHHIVPLAIGGGNDIENLVLVEKGLHRNIHWHLDHSSNGKTILVPTHPDGERIWIGFPHRPIVLRLNGEHFGYIP